MRVALIALLAFAVSGSFAVDDAAAQTSWTTCAAEDSRCAFTGTQEVRYGADVRWTEPRRFTDGVECTNAVFGDPAYGTAKRCERRPVSVAAPPTADFTVGPSAPVVGREITFDWVGTCEAGPCSLAWENEYADGPGGNDVAWGTTDPLRLTFQVAETKYVHLEVTDSSGPGGARTRSRWLWRPVRRPPCRPLYRRRLLYRRSVAGRSRVFSTRSMRSAALPPLWARLVGTGFRRADSSGTPPCPTWTTCAQRTRISACPATCTASATTRATATRDVAVAHGHVIRVLGGLVAPQRGRLVREHGERLRPPDR